MGSRDVGRDSGTALWHDDRNESIDKAGDCYVFVLPFGKCMGRSVRFGKCTYVCGDWNGGGKSVRNEKCGSDFFVCSRTWRDFVCKSIGSLLTKRKKEMAGCVCICIGTAVVYAATCCKILL